MPALSEPTIGRDAAIRIVTGERGAGKSTLCRRVAIKASEAGLVVSGMVTEDIGEDGTRRVSDLRTGENRHFGTQSKVAPDRESASPVGFDPLTPSWMYDAGVFAWGNSVLAHSTPCDLLVVDELGPLEILGDRGWFMAFEILRRCQYGTALVVCRPTLVVDLKARLGRVEALVYEVRPELREGLAESLLSELT